MTDPGEDPTTVERRRIAHDLSNQIMVVQGNLELLRMKLDRDERPWGHLEVASDAVERCRLLTERLSVLCQETS
jgi:hypothetical protein